MLTPLKVLTAGHSQETMNSLQQVLSKESNVKSASRLINGNADPLKGIRDLPDVLLLEVSQNWEEELAAVNARPSSVRPTILAMGPSNDPDLLLRGMRMGVRDFLTVPIDKAEVVSALTQIQEERRSAKNPAPRRLTAVVNAKGGSGATLLASNLGVIMAEQLKLRVALIDLNLQFGAPSLCLGLTPKVGIHDALTAAHELDATALPGYMTRHDSGLEVLANVQNAFVESAEVSPEQLEHVLTVVAQNYDHVIVDLPRSIDSLTLPVLARADRVLLVLQQHLSHLSDAKRLVNVLSDRVDGMHEKLIVAINRYDRKSNIGTREIEGALRHSSYVLIPNDYKRTCESEDQGVSLYRRIPSAPITRSLRGLAQNLSGVEQAKRGLIRRMFSGQQSVVNGG